MALRHAQGGVKIGFCSVSCVRKGMISTRNGKNLMKTPLLLLSALMLLAACNTVRGIGQDVQSVGKTVEKAGD